MTCNYCGVKNNPDNKFCTNCGEELTGLDNTFANICPDCGAENNKEHKFCISCGYHLNQMSEAGINKLDQLAGSKINNIQPKKKSKKQLRRESKNSSKRKNEKKLSTFNNLKPLWITVGVIIGSLLIAISFDLIFRPQKTEIPVEVKSTNPVIEAKVFEIASKFVCSCGSCNEEPLETCKCATAVDERQFIRDYLLENQKPDYIILAVANKYGWLEAEFASTFNVDRSKVWDPNQLILTNENTNSVIDQTNETATISDKYTIYSAFNCPCGQCGIDELRDCDCPHPKGAKEVKKFIDDKIIENKYTISEIIELVDEKYGGKKI